MQARDVMTTWVTTIGQDATVKEAAKLMLERGVSALPVLDEKERLAGIISEGDLVRRAELGTGQARSWWLRLFAATSESAAADFVKTHGALLLEKHRIKRVPVVRAGRLVGIVSRADLVRRLATLPAKPARPTDDRTLRRRMLERLKESGVDATYLNVSVSGRVLHLWGGVRSEAERQALRVAAEGVPGLRKVEDHTFVMPVRLQGSLGAQ